VKTQSAARKRVEGGTLGTTMSLSMVAAAALVP